MEFTDDETSQSEQCAMKSPVKPNHFEPFNGVEDSASAESMGLEVAWDEDPMALPLPPPPSSLLMLEYNPGPSTDQLDVFSPANRFESDTVDDPSVENNTGEPGVCGLQNLGNTCFMSAGVQSLMATAPIVVSLIRTPVSLQHALTRGLADLGKMIWTSKNSVIHPTQFKNALVRHFPQFNDYRQHDCQEFLALLLDGLHEQMNTTSKKSMNVGSDSRDASDSSSKKIAQHPSTSHQNCEKSCSNSEDSEEDDDNDVHVLNKLSCSPSLHQITDVINSSKFLSSSDDASGELASDAGQTKRRSIFQSPMSGDGVLVMNNSLQRFSGLEDILKTAKTSNVNVLIEQEEANNEIRFDSEKYPRVDNSRRRGEQFNTNSFQLYQNNTGGKRCKSSVTHFSSVTDFKEGLDLKRVKLHSAADEQDEKNRKMEIERQSKNVENVSLEKNQRVACVRFEANEGGKKDSEITDSHNSNATDMKSLATASSEGEVHWRSHLAANRSVIVDTFQGQFKSTVVCSACDFVSVTYEPFMYLSVPLPNALQRQISVTFISSSSNDPFICEFQANQYDSVGSLKEQLMSKIDCDRTVNITMAEVLNHHISKILDDSFLIRHLNDSDRRLYAFEIVSPVEIERVQSSKGDDMALDTSCSICFDEKCHMKQHDGCSCRLCDPCITASCAHCSGTSFKCPICGKNIYPDIDLVPLQNDLQSAVRMINVPVVFRVDEIGDGNNQKSVELFAHPRLLRVPSTVSSEILHGLLKGFSLRSDQYRLLLVDGKGHSCSRCMYNVHCRGCVVSDEGDIELRTSDTLAIAYSSQLNGDRDLFQLETNVSAPHKTLTLYDCIQAFSKSEQLDGNNPWFCPRCKENRCATKTLTVWRCPDYLIVYLKRFVFRNHISTKLEEKVIFPLVGLSLPSSDSCYDLYACVCHVGGVSAGHYTAYAQHPYTGKWHHFNDSYVSNQQPQEDDYNNAYILFYRKQGIEVPALNNEDVANNLN